MSISTFALNKGPDVLQQLIEHYSSWIRLKKAVAWILKVKNILLVRAKERLEQTADTAQDISKARQSQTLTNIRLSHRKENLTVEDLKEAELEIISHCQGQKFQEEITALLKGEPVKKEQPHIQAQSASSGWDLESWGKAQSLSLAGRVQTPRHSGQEL